MTLPEPYRIELQTTFYEWWRYDVYLVAALRSEDGEPCSFAHLRSDGKSREPAEGPSLLSMTVEPAVTIELYLYIVPNTLPKNPTVSASEPFTVRLAIGRGEAPATVRTYAVNQWGGITARIEQ